MAVYLTDDDVRSLLDWESALAALHEAYAAPVSEAHFPRGRWPGARRSGCAPSAGYSRAAV